MSLAGNRLSRLIMSALCHDRPGINVLVHGGPECGKTTLIMRLKELLEEQNPELVVNHILVNGTLVGVSMHPMQINLYECQTCPTEEAIQAQDIHFRVAFTRELLENPPNIVPKKEDRFAVHIYHYI